MWLSLNRSDHDSLQKRLSCYKKQTNKQNKKQKQTNKQKQKLTYKNQQQQHKKKRYLHQR